MNERLPLNYRIIIYYRLFACLLEEQKKIEIIEYDPDFTLREFVFANYPNSKYCDISILYDGKEVRKIDSIIINGKIKFNHEIDTISIKHLEKDFEGGQLIIYVDEVLGVGDTGGDVAEIFLALKPILDSIGYYFIALAAKDLIKQNLIDPIILKKAVSKRNEWSLEEFCNTFEIDSISRAGKILRLCGFKKDEITNNYRSKYYIAKKEPNDIEGVG